MALPETTRGWIERYEKRYQRAWDNYQNSGEKRYDSQAYEYQCIVDAFRAKQDREDERDEQLHRRMRNMNAMTERLYKEEYTRDEVIDLLGKAVWW